MIYILILWVSWSAGMEIVEFTGLASCQQAIELLEIHTEGEVNGLCVYSGRKVPETTESEDG